MFLNLDASFEKKKTSRVLKFKEINYFDTMELFKFNLNL